MLLLSIRYRVIYLPDHIEIIRNVFVKNLRVVWIGIEVHASPEVSIDAIQ